MSVLDFPDYSIHPSLGSLLGIERPSSTLLQRFLSKVDRRGADECWEWSGCRIGDGYGHIYIGHHEGQVRLELAHRVSWFISQCEWPSGSIVRHRCDNPPCVNPAHLELGTYTDNMRDMRDRGRQRYLRGDEAPRSKLTEQAVHSIIALHTSGVRQRDLARQFGVSQSTISAVFTGRNWSHIHDRT